MPGSVHLVVLIHGLWGSPAHLAAANEELERAWADSRSRSSSGCEEGHVKVKDVGGLEEDPVVTTRLAGGEEQAGELVIMIAGGMTSQLTYDGVDVCASRVAYEVDEKVAELEKDGKVVDKFSLMGYSLGGLVARYLVGLLHSRSPSFFDQHHPVSFSTISSPHYGIPIYNTLLSTTLGWLGSRVMSRSGEQLWVADKYSEEDPRPLLEIMADPRSVFYQGLEHFDRREIYASAINDHSVPYPTAAIEPVDHFAQWDERNISVEADSDGIIQSWKLEEDDDEGDKKKRVYGQKKKSRWGSSVGTLPPVLRYRFPFNYIILLLFPIMLPLIVILILCRQSLDSRRSRRRLQQLASASSSSSGNRSPAGSASGLSIQALRQGIRRIERDLESDLIGSVDVDTPFHGPAMDPGHPRDVTLKINLKDSQLRMSLWLNALPMKKYITWWPEVANAHATAIVRDPKQFPAHERGRGLLKLWAKNTLGQNTSQ
ncbi:hypothetical protein IAU60_001569 [Kwoniella sp. DSM 27419]